LTATADPGHLAWGVRRSFVDYVQRVGGTVSFGGAAFWHDGAFRFPAERGHSDRFSGEVLFSAHGGLLSVEIADPWLEENRGVLVLTVADFARAHRLPIAELERGGGWAGPHSTRITEAGSILLGGTYPVGTELDPVTLLLDDLDAGSTGA
jgi:hypothetical protein